MIKERFVVIVDMSRHLNILDTVSSIFWEYSGCYDVEKDIEETVAECHRQNKQLRLGQEADWLREYKNPY